MEGAEKAVRNHVHKLSFQASDAFLAARYGFNARNISVFWKGILKAWLTWTLFVYAGFYAAGDSMAERFSSSVLCPLPDALFFSSAVAVILLAAGSLLAVLTIMATSMKVSRLTFEQLRGDQFYSENDAKKFCRHNWKPLVMTPAALVSAIAIGCALLLLAGLAGRIPGAGSFVVALLAVPSWILGLFIILVGTVLIQSFFLVPVITGATGGDTFENLFELFSIVTSGPLYLLRGVLAGAATRIPAFLLLLAFSWGSVQLTGAVFDRVSGSSGTASAIESGFSRAAPELVPFYSSIFSPVSSSSGADVTWTGVPAALLAAFGTGLMVFLAACWCSGCIAMWTIVYLGARHRRDGEDLLLRAEEEEYREFRKIYGSKDNGGDRETE